VKLLLEKLTFANVISVIALFAAVGGSAFAATQLPKNSVGTKQIKKGAVTTAKIAESTRAKLIGSKGPKGDQGPPGLSGAPATTLFAQVKSDGTANAAGSPITAKRLSNGNYVVNFARDVTHCAAFANQGGIPLFTSPGASTGAAQGNAARIDMASAAPGEEGWAPGFPYENSVYVTTFSGSSANDSSFYVAVFC
jgi:hypothetical protein